MCSVVGCESWRRGAVQRYKLPEDPEMRLEWVQFLFEVNGQQLQESNWTDITICRDHFIKDCFENPGSLPDNDQLTSSAVPTLKRKLGPDKRPRPRAKSVRKGPAYRDVDCQCDLETGSHPDSSNAIPGGSDTENAVHPPTRKKFAVNESCLLELFRHKCPSCDSKLQTEKITHGLLTIVSQQCLECDYRYKWKSQIDASIPPVVEKHLTGGTEVTPETEQEMMMDNNPRDRFFSVVVSLSEEEDCLMEEEEEEEDDGGATTDKNPNLDEDFLLAEELEDILEEESEEDDEEDDDWEDEEESSDSQSGRGMKKLCPECGSFFYTHKPHTCEYKIKPFSCNICGKRCVTKISLHVHSRIHDESYVHPCKYCWVTFRTKTDKLNHEQVHKDNKDHYNCRKCEMTFSASRKRRAHMSQHEKEGFRCGVCDLEFPKKHHLVRHAAVHTGERPHKCSVCERAFAQASHLKSHMRLHTGERPFKCQHCDKSFNHNVSLKSHVQRYHAGSSGPESNKRKRETDSADADTNGNGTGSESEVDEVGENDAEEMPKIKRRWEPTGRPKGRPKRNIEGSNNKTRKQKGKKSKKTASSNEESDEEQPESDMSFDSAEEEETTRKSKGRSKRGPDKDSDSDFNPEEEMKGKSSKKTSGKQRGRTKKIKQEV